VIQPEDADPFGLLESLRDLRSSVLRPLESGYDALDALVAVCRNTVPAADAAAISYAGHGQVRSTHVTHPEIGVIDRWHNQTGAGPLLDEAVAQPIHGSVLIVEDLTLGIESGEYTVGISPPFRSLHSTTLRSQGGHRTALDLYATRPHALGLPATAMAEMFVRRATQLLYGADETRAGRYQLAVSLVSRCLDLALPDAEDLLVPHLDDTTKDPVVVAEQLIDHITGTDYS
jgi:hypothetical protein